MSVEPCGQYGHPNSAHWCTFNGGPVVYDSGGNVVSPNLATGTANLPTQARLLNQEWLVAYSVFHKRGQHVARAYMLLPVGEIVTRLILEKWEHELHRQYRELAMVTVSVISFQPL